MLKLLKARAVRIAARGVRPSDKGAQILASVKSKQILSKQVYNRTNQLDPGDEGSATIPMTVATVGFATNYAARGKYWAHDNWGPELSPFEGSTFKRSLPEIQKERLSAVSQRLGDVVKVPLGAKLHTPTLISNSFIALQQCLINAPVHIVSVRHPDDDIILAAAELSKGVGKKWLLLPGLVNPLLAVGGRSVLSGVPAGAYHLTGDLKEVARDYLLKNIQAGKDPEEVIIRLLAGADLNFAAVKPAAQQTLITAEDFPVGSWNWFPNLLLSQVFNDNGQEVILNVRDYALNMGIAEALQTLKRPPISQGTVEKYRTKAHQDSTPYLKEIVEETQVSAPMLAEVIKETAQSISEE